MTVSIIPGKLTGTVRVPSSKSVAHRMLLCAALAEGTSVLTGVDISRDIIATMDVLTALGGKFQVQGDTITVTGISRNALPVTAQADCCESGSTLRFLVPVAAALGISTTFIGQGRLPERPITAYRRELPKKGITFAGEKMPFTISGKLQSGRYEMEGNVSSQYITGLLYALSLVEGDSEIHLLSKLESEPYVTLTIGCMEIFGVHVEKTDYGYFVKGNQTYQACSTNVEGDYSQAAFFYVANALGSAITLENLNPDSVQGDKAICAIAEAFPKAFNVDAGDIPDLVPILAVLATFADGTSRIYNAQRLTIKESNRLETTADLINTLGGNVKVLPDGLEITPVSTLQGGKVKSHGDHRIAMCAAIAATRCVEPVIIEQAECIEKSYPQFYEDYKKLGGTVNVITMES